MGLHAGVTPRAGGRGGVRGGWVWVDSWWGGWLWGEVELRVG